MGRRALIVLDTHAWIWWRVAPKRLSSAAAAAIAGAERLLLSTMSIWELGMLDRRGRVTLHQPATDWVRAALAEPRLDLVAPDGAVALAGALLPDPFPGDPADRLIYATALEAGVRLVTRDERIARFDPPRALW